MAKKRAELSLYNTETRRKEVVKPIEAGKIKMYTCGPTVYHYAHIGNFRTYVFEDLLRRTLKHFGFAVHQVMNITDVDDKTIRGATAKGVTLAEFTRPYEEAFFADLDTLAIERAEQNPAATAYIPQMIEFIQDLIEKEMAYRGSDGSVYYSIARFPRYGCLSHLHLDELQVGASSRVSTDEYDKDHVSDFVLWKAYDPERDGKIYWESPFGKGRPGWHLECSTMAMQLLGDTLDIHCGGVDNLFPHHENEIAQSEARSGKRFVNLWLHSEHLLVDNKKMAKSAGNFYTLRDLLDKGFTGREVRYMLLHAHYRTQLNFTFEGLEGVRHALQRFDDFVLRLGDIDHESASAGPAEDLLRKAEEGFTAALGDDLNISVALASLFDLVREVNTLCDRQAVSKGEAQQLLAFLKRCDGVLAIFKWDMSNLEALPEDILDALQRRDEARRAKDWSLADQLRDVIVDAGYVLEDTPSGGRIKREKDGLLGSYKR